jgi:hypothetical protein
MQPELEVADIFRRHGAAYRELHAGALGRAQLRVVRAIELCRTAALDGHTEQCDAMVLRRVPSSENLCIALHRRCSALRRLASSQ